MTRSRFGFLIAAVCIAAGALASVAAATRDCVVTAATRAWDFTLALFRDAPRAQTKIPSQEKPRVALVAARSFVLRLMRRERPALTPGWRLCPST